MSNLINYFHEYLFALCHIQWILFFFISFSFEITFYKDALLLATKQKKNNNSKRIGWKKTEKERCLFIFIFFFALFIRIYNKIAHILSICFFWFVTCY